MIFSPTGSLRQEVSAPGIPGAGIALFNEVCARDLEGIVAKRIEDPYADRVWWVKVKNPAYTRAVGRGGAVLGGGGSWSPSSRSH